jgi:hypothetical protein
MSRYQIERENDALLKVLEHEARFGRPEVERRSRATPVRPADPVNNALLQNAQDYPLKAGAEFGAALACCAVALILVVVLIEIMVQS